MADTVSYIKEGNQELSTMQRLAKAVNKDVEVLRATLEKAKKLGTSAMHATAGASHIGFIGYQAATGQKDPVTAYRDVSVELKTVKTLGEGLGKTFDKIGTSSSKLGATFEKAFKGIGGFVREFTNEQKGFAQAIEHLGQSTTKTAKLFTGMTRVMTVATNPVVTAISAVTLAYDLMADKAIKAHEEIRKQETLTSRAFKAGGGGDGGYAARAASRMRGISTVEALQVMGMAGEAGFTGKQASIITKTAQERAKVEGKEIAEVIKDELESSRMATMGMDKDAATKRLREIGFARSGYMAPMSLGTDLGKEIERSAPGFVAGREGWNLFKTQMGYQLGLPSRGFGLYQRAKAGAAELGTLAYQATSPYEYMKRGLAGAFQVAGAGAGWVGGKMSGSAMAQAEEAFRTGGVGLPSAFTPRAMGGSILAKTLLGRIDPLGIIAHTFGVGAPSKQKYSVAQATDLYFKAREGEEGRGTAAMSAELSRLEEEKELAIRNREMVRARDLLKETDSERQAHLKIKQARESGDVEARDKAEKELAKIESEKRRAKETLQKSSIFTWFILPFLGSEKDYTDKIADITKSIKDTTKKIEDEESGFGAILKYGATTSQMKGQFQKESSVAREEKKLLDLREEQAAKIEEIEAKKKYLTGKGYSTEEVEEKVAPVYKTAADMEEAIKTKSQDIEKMKIAISAPIQASLAKSSRELLGESLKQAVSRATKTGLLSNEDIREIQKEVGRGGEEDYAQAQETIGPRLMQAEERKRQRIEKFAQDRGLVEGELKTAGAMIGVQAREIARARGMTKKELEEINSLIAKGHGEALEKAQMLLNYTQQRHGVEKAIIQEKMKVADTRADIKMGTLSAQKALRQGIISSGEYSRQERVGGQLVERGLIGFLKSDQEEARQAAQQVISIREQMYQDEIDFATEHAQAMMDVVRERYESEAKMAKLSVSAADIRMAPGIGLGRELWGVSQQRMGIMQGAFGFLEQQRMEERRGRELGEERQLLPYKILGIQEPEHLMQRRALRAQKEAEEDFARQKAERQRLEEEQRGGFVDVFKQLGAQGISQAALRGTEGGRDLMLQMMQQTQGAWMRVGLGGWVNKEMQDLLEKQRLHAAKKFAAEEEVRGLGAASMEEQIGVMEGRIGELGTGYQQDQARMRLAGKYREAAEYYAGVGDIDKTREYREKFEEEIGKLPDHMKEMYNDKQAQMNVQLEKANSYLKIIADSVSPNGASSIDPVTGVERTTGESTEPGAVGGTLGASGGAGLGGVGKVYMEAAQLMLKAAQTPVRVTVSLGGKSTETWTPGGY